MKTTDESKKSELYQIESQLVHFLLKNKTHIADVFYRSDIKADDFFTDEDLRDLTKIIIGYYDKNHSIITENELELYLNGQLSQKLISEGKYYSIVKVFHEALEWNFSENEFVRVSNTWLNSEIEPKIKDVLLGSNRSLLEKKESDKYITKVLLGLRKLQKNIGRNGNVIQIADLVKDADYQIADLRRRRENPEEFTGIKTGIAKLDRLFVGFEKGTLTLVGALTNTGKSTFILNISQNIAEKFNKKVLIVSLEMGKEQWFRKYNSLAYKVPYLPLVKGDKDQLSDEKFEFLIKSIEDRKNSSVNYKVICASANNNNWDDIAEIIKEDMDGFVPDIIFVDYLGLLSPEGAASDRRDVRLGELAAKMRAYAKTQLVPIVCVVQANRASVTRNAKGERKIDVNIENVEDSNKVGSHCDAFLALITLDDKPNTMVVKIAKQREGPQAQVEIRVELDKCRMYDPEDLSSLTSNFGEDDLFQTISEMPDVSDTGLDELLGINTKPSEEIIKQADELVGIPAVTEQKQEEKDSYESEDISSNTASDYFKRANDVEKIFDIEDILNLN